MSRAEQYMNAMNTEREAWDRLKSRLPGSPNYDQAAWTAWQAAISSVAQLIDVRRNALGPASMRGPARPSSGR
jgi:hypothetical protein